MKPLALLNAISSEGIKILQLVQFDLNSYYTDAYDAALNYLKVILITKKMSM